MKKFIFLMICLCLFACSQPEPKLKDSTGSTVQLTQLQDKWLILNYWAPWCHSCIQEIAELNVFHKKNPHVLVYGFDYDNPDVEEVQELIKKLKISYPVLVDNPSQAWNLAAIDFVPTTFIFNNQGKLVDTIVGPTDEANLSMRLAELQKKS